MSAYMELARWYDSLTGDPQSDSFVIPFKNLINDSYCKDISMKIRSSLEVKQKSGEFVGSFAPYGYMKSPENKNQLIVDEAVSEYVQMIFSMYKDGFSIGRIAKRLNQMGVLSPMEYKHSVGVKFDTVFKTGDTAKWTYKAVQRILDYGDRASPAQRGQQKQTVRQNFLRSPSRWVSLRIRSAQNAVGPYSNTPRTQRKALHLHAFGVSCEISTIKQRDLQSNRKRSL